MQKTIAMICLVLTFSCNKPTDPAKAETWLAVLDDNCATHYSETAGPAKQKCKEAIDKLAGINDPTSLPHLHQLLKIQSPMQSDIAALLGNYRDPSSVDPLIAAIDFTVGKGNSPETKAINSTNEKIAVALGKIGDKRAVSSLNDLMNKSRDEYVVLSSVRSLGELKAEDSVDGLGKIAVTHEQPFVRKNAIIALGNIASPKAIPYLIQTLFIEYNGVSFYPESSFSLYQIGPAVVDKIIETMEFKNDEINKLFEKKGWKKEAIVAKCAVVLGDLKVEKALDHLLNALKSEDIVVQSQAAFALGRLGKPEAIPQLISLAQSFDASEREFALGALNLIGDRSIAQKLLPTLTPEQFVVSCVKDGGFPKDMCETDIESKTNAIRASAEALTQLGDETFANDFLKLLETTKDNNIKAVLEGEGVRAKLVAECKNDATCYKSRLADSNWRIREKAAYELGRMQAQDSVKDLLSTIKDQNTKTRYAAIWALGKLNTKEGIEQIEKQLKQEEDSAQFVRVNEDLKRLLVGMKRL